MTKSPEAPRLAQLLWNARTPADVEAILSAVEAAEPLAWRAIGDRPNNNGTIRMASDPNLALIERVTNGMDAVLDFASLEHPGDEVANPREAARKWLGIPAGGLAEMIATERRNLAARLSVTFRDSGEKGRPTIVIQDSGTGQAQKAVPKTLCSLNESNKIKQPWTMGTYGQGGSVTFGFSRATVILTRRHPSHLGTDDIDSVSWTVVQMHQYDDSVMPTYEYLVGGDHELHTLPPALFPDFPRGTRIIHIGYDWRGASTPFTTNPWQFFHSALFDPVMPFMLAGDRTANEQSIGSRVIIGNAARLARTDEATARGEIEIAHADSNRIDLGKDYGHVTTYWWVVTRPEGSDSKTDPAASYVRADNAVCMTLFGQRQDAEPRYWIKERLQVPFLFKNLIVQISCDDLTARGKNEVFASTRERATRGDLHSRIFEAVLAAMQADGELKRLDRELRERVLSKSTDAASEKVRKRLRDFIKTRLKGLSKPGKGGQAGAGTGGARPPKRPAHAPSPPRDTDDSHLPSVPTYIRFQHTFLHVHQGGRTHVTVEINAKNGYLPDYDDDIELQFEGPAQEKLRNPMRSRLLGGESRWFFEANEDAPLGANKVIVTMVTAQGTISADATIEVLAPPPADPTAPGIEDETGPNVRWVQAPEAAELGWASDEIGEVDVSEEATDILIHRDANILRQALNIRALTEEAVNARAERYLFPVACALWLQYDAVKRLDGENRPSDDYQKAERLRIAEAVLLASNPDVDLAQIEGE